MNVKNNNLFTKQLKWMERVWIPTLLVHTFVYNALQHNFELWWAVYYTNFPIIAGKLFFIFHREIKML